LAGCEASKSFRTAQGNVYMQLDGLSFAVIVARPNYALGGGNEPLGEIFI
jgi:hypothetical protein